MLLRLQNAAASMSELAQRQDRVANNLANVNTVGYKRDRAFAQALDERIDADGAPRSLRDSGQWADLSGGAMVETGNPLDLAIAGDGFFQVRTPDGQTRLTRAGEFLLDADGVVRSPGGLELLGTDGQPITLPPSGGEIAIHASGEIRIGGVRAGEVGVVTVADPAALVRLDGATWDTAGQATAPAAGARVQQGMLESANVDPLAEMTELIAHVRLFESQQKSLQTTDEVLGAATRDLGTF